MCGISGVWSKNTCIDVGRFNAMRDTLLHRGPDAAGTWMNTYKNIALGHRRLSLIDLSSRANQPLTGADNRVTITVNGEIYNFNELRQELKSNGYIFTTQSDSEVLIYGWLHWKTELPKQLKGMFAFAIWDDLEKTLFIARDRFGIKPLYYHIDSNEFIFASELKSLINWNPALKELNLSRVADYFTYRYIPAPYSVFNNILKLPAAHCMLIDCNFEIKQWQYWDLLNLDALSRSTRNIVCDTKEILLNSLKEHMVADVPVGSLLSGGYDSGAMVSLLGKESYTFNTFSIGFANWDQSEHWYAKLVSDAYSMPLYTEVLGQDSLDVLQSLMYFYDEPIADISIVPTYYVFLLASQYNKAVLSGEGADEIFAGYTWYSENMRLLRANRFKNLISHGNSQEFSLEAYSQAMAMGHLRYPELKALFNPELSYAIPHDSDWFYRQHYKENLPHLKRFQYLDIKCFMGELVLTKIDRASMASSVEARVPFLDHQLVESLFAAQVNQVFHRKQYKYILYQLIKDSLPQAILKRKKQGFVGPDFFYSNDVFYQTMISGSRLVADKLLVESELQLWLAGKQYWKLWKFAVLEMWYKQWMT